ncbi:MAG TPA: glycerol-3-phosphate acyltransferase [Candidatus Bipolaricaulis anaerobius]|nr:glycerol-3-phosphate acyltransferase [Candidatus Bipolaricaulis anaerobius]HQM37968.1 glycerol-3-phosphate acyltransferase [Candidatus Bipolaricaulis anaerobius]
MEASLGVGAVVLGYLLGSLPGALIVGKLRGVNPRTVGTGNPGAANVYRKLGRGWGILVGCWDAVKGILPVWIARALGIGPWWAAAAAAAAVAGHNWPLFFHFRGGKGVATTLGAALALDPLAFAIAFSAFAGVFILLALTPAAPLKVPWGAGAFSVAFLILEALTGGSALLFAVAAPTLMIAAQRHAIRRSFAAVRQRRRERRE